MGPDRVDDAAGGREVGDHVLVAEDGVLVLAAVASSAQLVERRDAAGWAATHHVLAPTHPGWDGTPGPASLSSVAALAGTYCDLLDRFELRDVVVVGSSFGGWVASRLVLDDVDARVGALVLVDVIGPDVPGHPPYGPGAPPPGGTSSQETRGASLPAPADLAALRAYTGGTFTEPGLLGALAEVSVPALVVWGEHDPVVPPALGRAVVAALPDGRFALVTGAGHLPFHDAPDVVFAAVDAFVSAAGP